MTATKPLKIDGWWPSHFGTMMATAYSVLAHSSSPPKPLHLVGTIVLFILANLGIGTFAILLNDLTDLRQDLKSGARNLLTHQSTFSRYSFLFSALFLSVLPWFWMRAAPAVLFFVFLELFLFLLYSVPPIRLKERGWPGLLLDSLYGYVVPNTYTVLLFGSISHASALVQLPALLLWCFAFGLERILYHQLIDCSRDELSGARTFVTKLGWERSSRFLFNVFLPFLIISTIMMISQWYSFTAIVPSLFYLAFVWSLLSYLLHRFHGAWRGWTPAEIYHLLSERLIGTFVWTWLGLSSLVVLVLKFPNLWFLLPIQLILFPEPINWLKYTAWPRLVSCLR